MTQQIFRRADITGATAAAEIPTAVSNGGGGIQSLESMLRQVEGMEGTITRFLELFERFGNQMMKMRGFEAAKGGQGGGDPGAVDPGAVETEPLRATESRVASPSQPPVPPVIDYPEMAQKVYALALGALAQLPQELTIAEALTMARDRKTFVVPVIEAELRKLLE